MLLDGVTDWRELQRQYNTTTLKFILNYLRTGPKHCNNEAPVGSRLIPEELLCMLYGWKQRLKRQKYKFDEAKANFFQFLLHPTFRSINYSTAVLRKCSAITSLVITAVSREKSFTSHDLIYHHIHIEICHQRSVLWNINFVLADKDNNKPA